MVFGKILIDLISSVVRQIFTENKNPFVLITKQTTLIDCNMVRCFRLNKCGLFTILVLPCSINRSISLETTPNDKRSYNTDAY